MATHIRAGSLFLSVALLLAAACSREAEQVSTATENAAAEASSTIKTEIWVDDVQLSSMSGDAAQAGGYPAGQPLQLSMSVEDAPSGTVVTTYWYGPNNRQLSYESQTVDANERQLNFQQENTHAWPAGDYRAEVWVGDKKVEEESFNIVAG